MKIVINACFGGFGLSEEGMRAYWGRKGKQIFSVNESSICKVYFDAPLPPQFEPCTQLGAYKHHEYANYCEWYAKHSLSDSDIVRDDPDLVTVVEELGNEAYGTFAELKVVEIPDGVEWEIDEYDGMEHIAEKHRTWS